MIIAATRRSRRAKGRKVAFSYTLSRLHSRPAYVRRLVVRRPALLWLSVVAVLAAAPPFYGFVSDDASIGLIGLAACLLSTDFSLLTLIMRKIAVRSRADVVATFLFFGVLTAILLPVVVAIVSSQTGSDAIPAPLEFLGQGTLTTIIPLALLLLVPYAVLMGLLASWLAFVEITDQPSAA